jgi:predicted component of type VI protein secretion system
MRKFSIAHILAWGTVLAAVISTLWLASIDVEEHWPLATKGAQARSLGMRAIAGLRQRALAQQHPPSLEEALAAPGSAAMTTGSAATLRTALTLR